MVCNYLGNNVLINGCKYLVYFTRYSLVGFVLIGVM